VAYPIRIRVRYVSDTRYAHILKYPCNVAFHCPCGHASSDHHGASHGHQWKRMSLQMLSASSPTPTYLCCAESSVDEDFLCFQFATRDPVRQFEVLRGLIAQTVTQVNSAIKTCLQMFCWMFGNSYLEFCNSNFGELNFVVLHEISSLY